MELSTKQKYRAVVECISRHGTATIGDMETELGFECRGMLRKLKGDGYIRIKERHRNLAVWSVIRPYVNVPMPEAFVSEG